jgi:Transposase and inactivated derivatives
MTNEEREAVALFRYGLIAPILNNHCDRKTYLQEICAQKHNVPYYGLKEFSLSTVERWLSEYRKWGFDELKPKARDDKGKSRALDDEAQEAVLDLRQKNMHLSTASFYELAIKRGLFEPQDVSYHSINRLLSNNHLIRMGKEPNIQRKRFQYDTVNTLWQGDMSVGPYLVIKNRKCRTFLFAFLDDCSRLIPHAQFFFTENFEPMKAVLKEGMLRRGQPRMIYVDNGKVYTSTTLHLACAKLGISLIHTKPYDPEAKGKIERFFGTVRRCFYPSLVNEPVQSLEELNKRFWEWLDKDYHRKVHSGIEMTPLDAYIAQIDRVRHITDPTVLDLIFWHRLNRKVRTDGTITIQRKLFQVPLRYVGMRIEVRFDNYPPKEAFVFEGDVSICAAEPVNIHENARVRRTRDIPENPIDFRNIFTNNERNEKNEINEGGK